ncbi:MAG: OsmC family protein [Gemmatimonadaceae bacterium]|nr:OsmC family protein [Gemmatimonadaceae bacterium]
MKVVLESGSGIRLEVAGDGFEIMSEDGDISPYHLLAASLASCTALTVGSWAQGAGIGTDHLTISVTWRMVEDRPKRVAHIEQTLHWPELPSDRLETADRVAKLCPIHATLNAGTVATSRVALDASQKS